MNVEKLREQLKIDEGCVYKIYTDHLGYPTFGIGHLVLTQFPEVGQAGAIVSNVHGIGLIGGFLLVFFFFVAICMGE